MNAPVTAEATEVARIEAALDALLAAIIVADRAPSPPVGQGSTFAQIIAEFEIRMKWTQAQRQADRLLERPVPQALRNAVRTLGRRLHEIGGLKAMHDAMMRVGDMDPATTDRREGLLDRCWDHIGEWLA